MSRDDAASITAAILAGGPGTRLHPLVDGIPKPMAPVGGRPFLDYLLLQLGKHGGTRVVLLVGHCADAIEERYGDGADIGMRIEYFREEQPLGTAGAVKRAQPLLLCDDFIVMNGGSFLDADLSEIVRSHRERRGIATMALVEVGGPTRYGTAQIGQGGSITRFCEKGRIDGPALVNAGIYVFRSDVLSLIPEHGTFSLERQVFPKLIDRGLFGVTHRGYFTDIGSPEDYLKVRERPDPSLGAVGAMGVWPREFGPRARQAASSSGERTGWGRR